MSVPIDHGGNDQSPGLHVRPLPPPDLDDHPVLVAHVARKEAILAEHKAGDITHVFLICLSVF